MIALDLRPQNHTPINPTPRSILSYSRQRNSTSGFARSPGLAWSWQRERVVLWEKVEEPRFPAIALDAARNDTPAQNRIAGVRQIDGLIAISSRVGNARGASDFRLPPTLIFPGQCSLRTQLQSSWNLEVDHLSRSLDGARALVIREEITETLPTIERVTEARRTLHESRRATSFSQSCLHWGQMPRA